MGTGARGNTPPVASVALPRLRTDLVHLVHRGLDARSFSLAAARLVGRAVPFDGVCLLTMDPATLLPTGEIVDHGLPPAAMARMAEIELAESDYNTFARLARCPLPAASLSTATHGRLDRSMRHRELKRPNGFGDELRIALRDDAGTWGGLTLLRGSDRAPFTAAEARTAAALSGPIVEGLRRTVLLDPQHELPGRPADAGVLLVSDDAQTIAAADDAARAWLEELGMASLAEHPPPVVQAAARRAGRPGGDAVATARIRTATGHWLVVRGSMVGAQIAVILEPARPPQLAPLIADAYGLTGREREVTQLVARGYATSEIARQLHLAPYTVQDHLKAIFEKTGTGTRGGLVARLFVDHYAGLSGLSSTIRHVPSG